jgi:hypothetical protein
MCAGTFESLDHMFTMVDGWQQLGTARVNWKLVRLKGRQNAGCSPSMPMMPLPLFC